MLRRLLGAGGGIMINEFHPNSPEWVELYNPTDSPVDISGWRLEDSTGNTRPIPGSTVIGAKGFYVCDSPTSFLTDSGEQFSLYNDPAAGQVVDTVTFTSGRSSSAAVEGTMSRYPDGGAWDTRSDGESWWWMPSKGTANLRHPDDNPPTCNLAANLAVVRNPNNIQIGIWNVKTYGSTKAGRSALVDIIACVVSRYDVAVLLEIADSPDDSCGTNTNPTVCALKTVLGGKYELAMSPRVDTEQYAAFYRNEIVSLTSSAVFVEPDPLNELFKRQPHTFEFAGVANTALDFSLIVAHLTPSSTKTGQELLSMAEVVRYVEENGPAGKRVIFGGDLNADGAYFDEDFTALNAALPSPYTKLIGDGEDTTTSRKNLFTYDRIFVSDTLAPKVKSGSAKVFRFSQGADGFSMEGVKSQACNDGYDGAYLDCISGTVEEQREASAGLVSDHFAVELTLDGSLPGNDKAKSGTGSTDDPTSEGYILLYILGGVVFIFLFIFLSGLICKKAKKNTRKKVHQTYEENPRNSKASTLIQINAKKSKT